MLIDSQYQYGPMVPPFPPSVAVKNEPMLFAADRQFAQENGGEITRAFLQHLSRDFYYSPDLIIDSRVHMLMPGWYPCIPGFHHDDVPRERSDGQPEYHNPSYRSRHCLMLVGGCSATEFATGVAEFPDVPIGQKYYKVWHPIVCEKIKSGELHSSYAPFNMLIYFDDRTWHQGTPAYATGFRLFIRASINTGRKPQNEIRRQTQVYLEKPMEGW